jgi:hypothetical protein
MMMGGRMMHPKKKALLAAASALAAVAAMALPASASASVWLKEGQPLKEKVQLSLSGGEVIETSGGAMLCNDTATISTEGGSAAQITAYSIAKATCVGFSGNLSGCEVTAATTSGLPWSVTVNTVDLTAKGVAVTYSLNEACAVHKIEVSFASLTLTPEEPSAIRFFHFKGEGPGKVDGKESTLTFSGVLELPEAEFGKYGIG